VELPIPTPTAAPISKRPQALENISSTILAAAPGAVQLLPMAGDLNKTAPMEKPGNPGAPLIVGIVPALILTAGILLAAFIWRRRS
jgi:hypothetical protein